MCQREDYSYNERYLRFRVLKSCSTWFFSVVYLLFYFCFFFLFSSCLFDGVSHKMYFFFLFIFGFVRACVCVCDFSFNFAERKREIVCIVCTRTTQWSVTPPCDPPHKQVMIYSNCQTEQRRCISRIYFSSEWD